MGTSCSWIFQFPHKISEGENIEKTNYENIKKIKRLKVKLEILKIKIERKKKKSPRSSSFPTSTPRKWIFHATNNPGLFCNIR